MLITSRLTLNLPSGFPLLAANEYLADDVNKFANLAAAPHPVGVLSQATDGQPQRSLPLAGDAAAQRLRRRVARRLRGQCRLLGVADLVRDRGRPDFDPDIMLPSSVAGTLVAGLRHGGRPAGRRRPAGPGSPGWWSLDRHGQVESLTPAARHWLDELGETRRCCRRWPPRPEPAGRPRPGACTPAGQWLMLHGAQPAWR